MAVNIPFRGQTHFKSSTTAVPFPEPLKFTRHTNAKPWSSVPSSIYPVCNNNNNNNSASSRGFLLSASLPERVDAMLSKSLLEQCTLENSSRETSPRSSLNNHHACGSWKSRGGGLQQKVSKAANTVCSSSSPKQERLRERFSKQEGAPSMGSPGIRVSALSAALNSQDGQVDVAHVKDSPERRRMDNRLAQRSQRKSGFSLTVLMMTSCRLSQLTAE